MNDILLSIDPGYAIIGYGIMKKNGSKIVILDYGHISTLKTDKFAVRLNQLAKALDLLIQQYAPGQLAVEELFFSKNTKTAMKVAHARGVILNVAVEHGLDVFEYTPLQVKQAVVGYGRADKNQVQEMVKRLLSLKEIPKPDDVADALAIGVCHLHTYSFRSKLEIL